MMKRILLIGSCFLLSLTACAENTSNLQVLNGDAVQAERNITNFRECADAGYLVMKTLPARCRTPDGRIFVEGRGLVSKDEISKGAINSFDECVAAGNAIRRTLPASCMTKDGQVFTDGAAVPPRDLGIVEPGEAPEMKKMSLCRPSCGNGTCEEIVCMAEGCPCPETKDNCPADCS